MCSIPQDPQQADSGPRGRCELRPREPKTVLCMEGPLRPGSRKLDPGDAHPRRFVWQTFVAHDPHLDPTCPTDPFRRPPKHSGLWLEARAGITDSLLLRPSSTQAGHACGHQSPLMAVAARICGVIENRQYPAEPGACNARRWQTEGANICSPATCSRYPGLPALRMENARCPATSARHRRPRAAAALRLGFDFEGLVPAGNMIVQGTQTADTDRLVCHAWEPRMGLAETAGIRALAFHPENFDADGRQKGQAGGRYPARKTQKRTAAANG